MCIRDRGSGMSITEQLQPVRTSQFMFRAKRLKSGRHVSVTIYSITMEQTTGWFRTKEKTPTNLKITYGAPSLMTKSISCNQMKQIILNRMLDSDSNQRVFHHSKQFFRWSARKLVRTEAGLELKAEPSSSSSSSSSSRKTLVLHWADLG